MENQVKNRIRNEVRARYGQVARRSSSCCSGEFSCCGSEGDTLAKGLQMGYSAEDLTAAPEGANLSLGCGNPGAIAALRPGEVVLDLGSGAGFDCFLAANQVGAEGQVIGVDMTPDMVSIARENAASRSYTNVDFRLGEIEHLPVADNSVNVIISNCVVNLSPDKQAVFNEAFRVLVPGGRLAIADTVTTAPLPEEARRDLALWAGCIAGSASIDDLEAMLSAAGFSGIRIQPKDESRVMIREWTAGRGVEDYVLSATIEAVKPAK
ncbi:MAG: arsenite methyltransferase [Anaerolineae bacterium]